MEDRLDEQFHEALRKFEKSKLKALKKYAVHRKSEWPRGTPPEEVAISFRSEKVWHNGFYKDGSFYIVGDTTKKQYSADKWFLL